MRGKKKKKYYGRTVKNKLKLLTQVFLRSNKFLFFRIINRITALLVFKEHLFFFDTSETSIHNQDSINKWTRTEHGKFTTYAYSKKNENQGICGTQ